MAIFYFPCPFCQKEVKADTEWIGESCDCPHCDYSFLIPEIPGTEKKRTASQLTCGNTFFTVHCPRCSNLIQENINTSAKFKQCPKCKNVFPITPPRQEQKIEYTIKQKISDFFLTLGTIVLVVGAIAGLIGLYFADTGIERAVCVAPYVIFFLIIMFMNRLQGPAAGGALLFGTITVSILLWFSSCCSSCRATSEKTSNERMESEQNGHQANAWHYATVFVKKRLKAPSTADFEKEYVRNNGNVWEVGGFVNAQNSFGVKLRNGFYCKLEYNREGANKTWTEINTVIFE